MISSSNFFKKTFFGFDEEHTNKPEPISPWNQKRYSTIDPPRKKVKPSEPPQMTMSIEYLRRLKAKKVVDNMKLPVIEPSRMLRFIPTRNENPSPGLLIRRRSKQMDDRGQGKGRSSLDLRRLSESLQLTIDSQRRHSKNMIKIVGSPTRRLAH